MICYYSRFRELTSKMFKSWITRKILHEIEFCLFCVEAVVPLCTWHFFCLYKAAVTKEKTPRPPSSGGQILHCVNVNDILRISSKLFIQIWKNNFWICYSFKKKKLRHYLCLSHTLTPKGNVILIYIDYGIIYSYHMKHNLLFPYIWCIVYRVVCAKLARVGGVPMHYSNAAAAALE